MRVVEVEGRGEYYYSRVTLCQIVMESGHPWRIFVVVGGMFEDGEKDRMDVSRMGSSSGGTTVQCIGSTSTLAGRPTNDIIGSILGAWIRDHGK